MCSFMKYSEVLRNADEIIHKQQLFFNLLDPCSMLQITFQKIHLIILSMHYSYEHRQRSNYWDPKFLFYKVVCIHKIEGAVIIYRCFTYPINNMEEKSAINYLTLFFFFLSYVQVMNGSQELYISMIIFIDFVDIRPDLIVMRLVKSDIFNL